ncbi:SH3 domain-containing protein [Thiorhodovibrio litoralis]|uniref:SH3 domain-containing protein n=1 Tax=Thiorhodovibrio litoralis TaxID=2952932 RepID=UPI00389A9378
MNKDALRLLAAGILLAEFSHAYATGDWCGTPIKTSDGFVNLRSGPGANHRITGQVHNGDLLRIDTGQCRDDFGTLLCDESGKWVFVQSVDRLRGNAPDQKGWINSRYVSQIACVND